MEKSITITGINGAVGCLADVRALIASTKPMQGIVDDIATEIKSKTEAGKDYMARNFNPYSAAYAKKKGTTRPDLKVSGTMIGAIKTNVINPNHGKVFVDAVPEPKGKILADQLAQIHNDGEGKQPKREFMNVNESKMKSFVKVHYDDPILEIVRRSPRRG
jgi:hypothetical protein